MLIATDIQTSCWNSKKGAEMLKITFMYRDEMSGWKWKEQTCIMGSVRECIKLYGLGIDCEYKIVSVEKI